MGADLNPSDRVLFAFCIASRGLVSLQFAHSLRGIVLPMNTAAIPAMVLDEVGGEIAECRNRCVAMALAAGATHLFWLDDDVCVTERILIALQRHDRDIVSGVYFSRHELSEPLIFPHKESGTAPFQAEGTSQAWATGMGLCLIRASVYRKLIESGSIGKDKYGQDEFYRTIPAEEATCGSNPGEICLGSTEDFFFFEKTGRLGYSIMVDHSQWCFGWHVERKPPFWGFPREQYRQMCEGKPIVWKTAGGEKVWK